MRRPRPWYFSRFRDDAAVTVQRIRQAPVYARVRTWYTLLGCTYSSVLSRSESSHKPEQWAVRSRDAHTVHRRYSAGLRFAKPQRHRGYRGFRSTPMRITEHNRRQARPPVPFNPHSTENNEKCAVRKGVNRVLSRDYRETRAVGRITFRGGERHDAIASGRGHA